MEPKVRVKIMLKKMGAEIRRTDMKLKGMREHMEVTMRGLAKLLEEVQSMREEVAAVERTRRRVEKAMNDMEEEALLEESFKEEFSFDVEVELEGQGAMELKEEAIIEEEEVMPQDQIKDNNESHMEVNEDLL